MIGSLPRRLLSVIERFPGKECLVMGARRVTYGHLGILVSDVASCFDGRIEKGSRVAVVMENSPEYVAACYGTWLAGGAVVGLNPLLKAERLVSLIEHCGAEKVLIDDSHPELHAVRERLASRIDVEEVGLGGGYRREQPVTEKHATEEWHSRVKPLMESGQVSTDSLASIVYTSGTTGHPKGVMLTHGNLETNTDSILDSLPVSSEDRAMCLLPFQYSYGASVLHTHLSRGATLILERSFSYPHRVLETMVAEGVTTLPGVPSTFRLLLRRTDLSRYDLSRLRYFTVAGGPASVELIAQVGKHVPNADIYVMYGQTEAAPRLSCLPPEDLGRKAGSAGKAIPGVELRIRNEKGEGLPPGVPGEVEARGGNIMAGYWADPQETARVLADGWLRTGDIGYMDSEGYLFLQGRLRELIKSGAHRIAPVEIEEVIRGVPGVRDVAVSGMEDDLLGEVPKAWVIPSGEDRDLRRRILQECQHRLARFKMPKDVEFLSEFPRTSSGKVQKHLLGRDPSR